MNGRGYLRKKRSELAITLSPKWIVFFFFFFEKEKEKRKGRRGRNLGDGSNEEGQGLLPNPPTAIVY